MPSVIRVVAPAVAAVLVVACGGGSGGGGGGGATITVTGKLLDYTGQAAGFLPVRVGGKVTSSDASGNFSVSGVKSPYELVVLQATMRYAQVFEGVTTKTPIVLALGGDATARSATVHVAFTGVGTGTGLLDVSNPVNANGGVTGSVGKPGTSYDDGLNWTGPTTFQGNACAILYDATGGVATAFNAYGETDGIYVQDGQTSSAGVSMASVLAKTITGTVPVPPGYTLHAVTMGFVCGSNAKYTSYPFTFDVAPSASFAYNAPVIPGPLYLGADAQKGSNDLYVQDVGVAPDATGVQLTLPTPVEQASPPDLALGISGTTSFSWSGASGALSQVYFVPTVVGPLLVTVFTASPSTTFPDLSSLGYPSPKGTTYKWSVVQSSNLATLDAALSGVPPSYLASYTSASTGSIAFTTAP
jgi:hypothetical protein